VDLRIILLLVVAVALLALLAPWMHREREAPEGRGEDGDSKREDETGASPLSGEASENDDDAEEVPDAVELPITGTLDLHTFSPKEVGRLVPDWIEVCRDKGLLEVRIIHGKGKGVLRRTVHSILDRHPAVEGYELAGAGRGDWGATIVRLEPRR
jgi:DNA-nicking Smr family endonuclease